MGAEDVRSVLRAADITIKPVDAETAEVAMGAWRRYGKGRHAARVDLGDCFTDALAEQTGFPVLCTGEDVVATDLVVDRP